MRGRKTNCRGIALRIDTANDLTPLEHCACGMIAVTRHRVTQLGDHALVETLGHEVVDRSVVVNNPHTDNAGLRQRASGGADLPQQGLWITLGHEALGLLEEARHALCAVFVVHRDKRDDISTFWR